MLNNIVALNNRAISYLQQDTPEYNTKAIACFFEALRRLRKQAPFLEGISRANKFDSAKDSERTRITKRPIKRHFNLASASLTENTTNNNEVKENNDFVTIFQVPITMRQKQRAQAASPSSSLQQSGENLFSLYQQAFIISPKKSHDEAFAGTAGAKKLSTQIYIVLLYNIGLAFHNEGMKDNSEPHLLKARKFYDLAMSKIALDWKTIDTDKMLLLLAVSNNLGHIHSHLHQFHETQKILIWLRHLMKVYKGCNVRGNIISENDYFFFLANCLFSEELQLLSCAPMA